MSRLHMFWQDVTYGAVYSILILVLLTTWTWGVVNKWHIRSTRFRNTFLAYVLWLMVLYQVRSFVRPIARHCDARS